MVFGAELDEVRRLVSERQELCDVDTEEAAMFEDHVAERLGALNYSPEDECVWVPSSVMAVWYGEVNGSGVRHTVRASRAINQQIEEGSILRLVQHKTAKGRGFKWTGKDAGVDAEMAVDLEVRMEEQKAPSVSVMGRGQW